MKLKFLLKYAALVLLLTTAACKKDDDDKKTDPTPAAEQGFFYGENGANPLTKADDSWVNGAYNTIIAQKSSATVVEINLNALTEGTYALSGQNVLTYVKGGYWSSSAGNVVITKNKDGKLSGTYEATAGSGVTGVNSVKGTFTDIPVK